jgi:tetratricopeptide (TPR) repeat protein
VASNKAPKFLVFCCAAIIALALPRAVAGAQDVLEQDAAERRVDLARTLFNDGVALVEERRYAEAEALFRQALEHRDAPAIRYNLASVLFEQGEYPEARALAAAVLEDETTPASVREHTAALVSQLDARAGYARIELSGGEAAVAIDGHVLSDTSREVPLAPGPHVATATRGEGEVARAELEIASGEHRVIALDVAPAEAETEAETESGPEPLTPPAREPELVEQWWFWTVVGGGAAIVALIIGIVVATSVGVEDAIQGDFDPAVLRW